MPDQGRDAICTSPSATDYENREFSATATEVPPNAGANVESMVDARNLVYLRNMLRDTADPEAATTERERVLWAEAWGDLVEHFVRMGLLEFNGRNFIELMEDAQRLAKGRTDLPRLRVNYVNTLRIQAQSAVAGLQEELGITLLVTAIEHLVNEVLTLKMEDANVSHVLIGNMLRRFQFHDKVGWLWTDTMGEPMEPELRKTIMLAVEARNAFVHQKLDRGTVEWREHFNVKIGVEDGLVEPTFGAIDSLAEVRRKAIYRGFDRDRFVEGVLEVVRRVTAVKDDDQQGFVAPSAAEEPT